MKDAVEKLFADVEQRAVNMRLLAAFLAIGSDELSVAVQAAPAGVLTLRSLAALAFDFFRHEAGGGQIARRVDIHGHEGPPCPHYPRRRGERQSPRQRRFSVWLSVRLG